VLRGFVASLPGGNDFVHLSGGSDANGRDAQRRGHVTGCPGRGVLWSCFHQRSGYRRSVGKLDCGLQRPTWLFLAGRGERPSVRQQWLTPWRQSLLLGTWARGGGSSAGRLLVPRSLILLRPVFSGKRCRGIHQPKQLSKGGVLRKRETSSLVMSDRSCVRNALLEMVNGALLVCLRQQDFVVVEGLDSFKLGVVATGGRLSHQATCPMWKGFLLDGFLGVEPRSVGIALANDLCDFGRKSLWLKASRIAGGELCPFWIRPWHLPYKWGKAQKTCQGSWNSWRLLVAPTSCLFRDSLGWPAEHQSTSITRGWLQSALGRYTCLPSCRTMGFSTSALSRNPVSALMWSAKNGIPKSYWIAC
jgi:hypothetical protein